MATKKKSLKAFVYLGKIIQKVPDGKDKKISKALDQYVVIPEDLAKFIGVAYSTKPPADEKIVIKNGALKGRTITRAVSTAISGKKYTLIYDDGLKTSPTTGKQISKVKRVPIYVPTGVSLREILKAVTNKFPKKPTHFVTPAGVKTRFTNV